MVWRQEVGTPSNLKLENKKILDNVENDESSVEGWNIFWIFIIADEFETEKQNPRFKLTKSSPLCSNKSIERATKLNSFQGIYSSDIDYKVNISKGKFKSRF